MEKHFSGKEVRPLIIMLIAILLPMALYFCDYKTGQYRLAPDIDNELETTLGGQYGTASGGQSASTGSGQSASASSGQFGTIAGEQYGTVSGGQSASTGSGQSVSASSGQPGTITGGQYGTAAGGQSASTNSGQPGTTIDGQSASASSGQPGTIAGGQSASASSGQSGATVDGQSFLANSGQSGTAIGGQPGTTIDGQSDSASSGQPGTIADGQSASASSGQSGATADGQSFLANSGQSGTAIGGQSDSANSGQSGTIAGGQLASASSGQPGTTTDGQSASASSGQPGTIAGGQSASANSGQSGATADGQSGTAIGGQSFLASSGQPGTVAGGQSLLPQLTQGENGEITETVQRQPVAVRVIPPVPDTMTLIRGGEFFMGNSLTDEEEENEEIFENEPMRLVTVRSFYIGKYEVTQREYEEVMGTNPSYFKGPRMPVESVSWFDAVEYCNKLSLKVGLTPAYTITGRAKNRIVTWNQDAEGYRLPTDAEWEYACRAGTTTPFNTGSKITRAMANYWGNRTRTVGSYDPNNWGLYDMHGNVAEWCWDLFGDYDSEESSEIHRVFRGGNWLNTTIRIRSGFRDHFYPNHRNIGVGFRIVRNTF